MPKNSGLPIGKIALCACLLAAILMITGIGSDFAPYVASESLGNKLDTPIGFFDNGWWKTWDYKTTVPLFVFWVIVLHAGILFFWKQASEGEPKGFMKSQFVIPVGVVLAFIVIIALLFIGRP